MDEAAKPLVWVGSSKKDLKEFPEEIQNDIGFALWQAQLGLHPHIAKVLRGFHSAGVLEVIASELGSSFRAVDTIRFAGVVYVLHVFQKKSKQGIKTPAHEIELVYKRLRTAEDLYAEWKAKKDQRDQG